MAKLNRSKEEKKDLGDEFANSPLPGEKTSTDLVQVAREKLGGLPAIQEQEEKVLGLSKFRNEMAEAGRIVLPFIKIVQGMSDDFTKDGINPGVFRNSLTGEVYGDTIEIRPAGVFHWRRRWNKDNRREILCSSNNSIEGFGDPGGVCKACPMQIWYVKRANGETEEIPNIRNFRTKKDEELVPPPCNEQYVFPSIVLNSTWKVPGALVFHRSGLNEGLRLYSMIEWTPPDAVYEVGLVKTTNEKGTWFSPKIQVKRKLTEEEVDVILNFRNTLKKATEVEVAGIEGGGVEE